MSKEIELDEIRAVAMAHIDRSKKNFRLAFFGAVAVEATFIASFLLMADFSNRLHLLLLISTVSCYSIVVLGLLALGAHINRSVLRILKAVELLKS